MLIAIAIGMYLLIAPVKTTNSQGQQGTTSYLGQVQQARVTGNRTAVMQQCRALAQMVAVIELSDMTGRSGPTDTQGLIDKLRADGSLQQLGLDAWNAPNSAYPPIVYVPERQRGRTDIVFYEHTQNHNGEGGHIAYSSGGVQWLSEPEFSQMIADLPQATW